MDFPVKTDDLIECSCRENVSHEADADCPCNICDGEGYLFDDHIVVGFRTDRYGYQDIEERMSHGKHTFNTPFVYIEYHEDVSRFDLIIDPVLDREGHIVSPLRERMRYNIHYAEDFRADNGRIEYWRLSCFTD